MVPRDRILIASGDRMRLRRTSCRRGDFQTKFLKIRKYRNYKQLILFKFFIVFLVSFETVWKYLTLTGTIWAQSNQCIKEVVEIFISTVEAART
jgi:hypothetical protein